MTIRIAMIGTGYIARVHARVAQSIPDVQLVAVVNHRPESMALFASKFAIERQYPDMTALLEAGDVDAVSINTPNYLHADQAIAALRAGVHVLVEKPMAVNAAEGLAMVEASRASGARLMVAHCWRFDEEVKWLRDQVADGAIGSVVRTKGYGVHTNWGPSGWFTQARYAGGGAMADMGIHAVDTVRFLLGDPRPVSVYGRVGTHYGDYDVDDTGIVIINWDNGASSYIESGWWQPQSDGSEAATRLYGSGGYGSLYPTQLQLPERATRAVQTVDPGFAHPRDAALAGRMYAAQFGHFVESIKSGHAPSPDGEDGLINMRIVDAVYASSRSGQVIDLGSV